jgi:putative acetyltransferase
MIIREACPNDIECIFAVHKAAFESTGEAHLVDALRSDGALCCSLVAMLGDQVVGHIASSLVRIEPSSDKGVAGLGPLGVLPAHQRHGIGTALMQAIIEASRRDGLAGLVLLGDPAYYSRFGFAAAAHFNLKSHYTAGEAFQAMPLHAEAFASCRGEVHYNPRFDELD